MTLVGAASASATIEMVATIKDVAREAGVSVASVSRALNGSGTVVEAKRRHIEAVAQRLNYVPHGGARSLITRRTHTIGVLLPDLHGEFFSELIRGIDLASRERGLHILVSGSHGDAAEATAAIKAMRGRVDGMLVMSPYIEPLAGIQLPGPVPTVLMNASTELPGLPAFSIDNYGGAYAATKHLLGLGHRDITIVTGPEDNFDARERLRGYRAALDDGGVAEDVSRRIAGDFTEDSGYRAAREVLSRPARPQAIFASNDTMAIGCLFGLREAGIRVPEDIALVGFDDIPVARYVSPPLTSVRISITQLGMTSLAALVELIDRSGAADITDSVRILPVELVVRASCGADRLH